MKLFVNDLPKLPFGDTGFQLSTFESDASIGEANPWDIINLISISDARAWQKDRTVIESADIDWLVEYKDLEKS